MALSTFWVFADFYRQILSGPKYRHDNTFENNLAFFSSIKPQNAPLASSSIPLRVVLLTFPRRFVAVAPRLHRRRISVSALDLRAAVLDSVAAATKHGGRVRGSRLYIGAASMWKLRAFPPWRAVARRCEIGRGDWWGGSSIPQLGLRTSAPPQLQYSQITT
jgi:hypothetical protein